MGTNRFLALMYALSVGGVGVWMPCKVLASLWRFCSFAGFWDEIIPLCFLVALSVGLLIGLFRNCSKEKGPR